MKATYAYLADGTKLAVMTDTVVELYTSRVGGSIYDTVRNGFDYLGSMVYKTLYSTRTLESTDFGGGRINRTSIGNYDINYFITDHLGSTRVITDNTGSIKEQNDYYPFGMRHSNANLMLSANRYLFNGKEKQTTGNINYMDYGARMYDDFTGRWFVIDPLAEKYYPFSSYTCSANNPLRFVDPNGMDIYRYDDKTGNFLLSKKTDDNFDQVGKFKKNKETGEYELKTNKKGEAKTRINNVEKGILKDGINFKNENNIIAVNGEGQATENGVESFVVRLADMVGKEIGGASFSKDNTQTITHISIGAYARNSYNKSLGHGNNLWHSFFPEVKQENSLRTWFHTHPVDGYSVSDRISASQADKKSRNRLLQQVPHLRFYILTHPVTYGDKFPYKKDYTND